jgi:putative DNA primase/helicase
LAEGIENALSVTQATGLPAWSTLSAVGMRFIVLPPEVREVTLAADGDDAGTDAAVAVSRRFNRMDLVI